MARDAGPAGTGLIPPIAGGNGSSPPVADVEDDRNEPPLVSPPDDSAEPSDVVDIDGVPPVPAGDDGDTDDGDGGEIDPDEFRNEIIDEVQRRFDRAISRVTRRLDASLPAGPPAGGGNDDDGDGGQPPARHRHSAPVQVDTSAIRMLARDRVQDVMENAGSAERRAVKEVLDRVLPRVDWNLIDDRDEFVDDLIGTLATQSTSLVKVGSDRKVAQLRQSGVLPEQPRQPGGGAGRSLGSTAAQMQRGATTAKRRWPSGSRRHGG